MDCIIVDDNLMARNALKLLIDQVDFLNLKKECTGPLEAFNYLETEAVDLVFLDVEMPGMTGIELIKNLKKRPIIILVTSKKDYAVEAFELNVADYLIKPVTLSRFIAAVDRAKEINDSKGGKVEINEKDHDYIFVRSNSALTKIKLEDIIYIQALGDYVKIFTQSKHNLVHSTLKNIEEKLPANRFFRLHRSYLVAISHIDKVEENTAYIGKHSIPIGEQYKKELLNKLNLF
ncbi:MAG TPA: LytTR family DNA-binding domain-containing protein [Bacteroidia bacterium]|jgi:two-component system LytT family response regulator|nr:LytTR family DNA-binding domain-containing protein [Bacteroidia bacterium]